MISHAAFLLDVTTLPFQEIRGCGSSELNL